MPGLDALPAVKRLKKLHLREHWGGLAVQLALDDGAVLAVRDFESHGCRQALANLRRTKPGIVIDGDENALDWGGTRLIPFGCLPADAKDLTRHGFVRRHVRQWKDGQNEFQRAARPAGPSQSQQGRAGE